MEDIFEFIQTFMAENNAEAIDKLIEGKSLEEIAEYLVEKGLFGSVNDVKRFLFDAPLYMLSRGEFDLPIKYYAEEEDCSGIVNTGGLTDRFLSPEGIEYDEIVAKQVAEGEAAVINLINKNK